MAYDTKIKRDEHLTTLRLDSKINTDFTHDYIGSFVTEGGGVIQKDLWILGDLQIDGAVNIPSNSNATQLQGTDISAVAPTDLQILQYLAGPDEWTPVSNVTLPGDLIVSGNFIVNGTTTTVNSTDLQVEDNIILVNKGEAGAGVSAGTAGIQIDRGISTDFQILFNEATDQVEVGLVGSLEPVALREGTPTNTGVAFWNSATKRFETDTGMTYNSGTDTLSVTNFTIGSDLTVPGTANICDIYCAAGNFTVVSNGANENILMGGASNSIAIGGTQATVSGGVSNTAFIGASVGGGSTNSATGNYAAIPGGLGNTASGMYTFAVGRGNTANMNYGAAMGYAASSAHVGSYVWSDGTGTGISSAAANDWTARASGGFRFVADTNLVPVNGVQIVAGQNTIRTLAGAYVDANAVQIQGINVDSVGSPLDGQVLVYRSGSSRYEFEDQTGTGGGGGIFQNWNAVGSTNISSLTSNYTKYQLTGDAVLLIGDIDITPTGSVSFVDITGLPYNATTVVGSENGNSALMSRISDSVLSIAQVTAPHATDTLRITSVFDAGQSYNIKFQLFYSVPSGSFISFTASSGSNINTLTIRSAYYLDVGEATLIHIDVRVSTTSDVSFIEMGNLPHAAVLAASSSAGTAAIIKRVSDGALSPANFTIDHASSTMRVTSIFSSAQQYDISAQIFYPNA